MRYFTLLIIITIISGFSANAGNSRQLRGMWISTVLNIDFPKTEGETSQKQEITDILDRAEELNMNAVFFQVRGMSDAFYKSELVPTSLYLKSDGVLTYDPLEFIIEEAHKRNIELHAWFNPYRVSMYLGRDIPEGSVLYTHPEWVKTAKDRYVIDPGIPEARLWTEDCVMEVVRNYDIDGVHFDDYFYYESESSPLSDDDTYALYGKDFASKADWRRNNTYLLIKELSEKIRSEKPHIKFGISPAGVWRNKADDPEGSDTIAGLPNYDRSYADTRCWVREEIIDYIAPQIYWSFDTTAAPYDTVVDWWVNETRNTNVQLYIGQALYRADEFGINEIIKQNEYNNSVCADGSIMFSASQTEEYYDVLKAMWQDKALIPEFTGRNIPVPTAPYVSLSGISLSVTDTDENTKYFCIFDENGKLVDTVRKSGKITRLEGKYNYTVSAANANHILSERAKVKSPSLINSFRLFSTYLIPILSFFVQ